MKFTGIQIAAILILVSGITQAGEAPVPILPVQPAPAQANCELRMVQPSQAGSVYISTFTPDKEACLKLQDDKTQAIFKNSSNRLRRNPVGPKEDAY